MKNDLLKSHRIRSRFLKDYSLPFNLVHDPYFEYFLELFDEDYSSMEAYHYLEGLLFLVSNDEEWFFTLGEQIKNEIIARITSTAAYSKFTTADLSTFQIESPNPTGGNLYTPSNSGSRFVSVDLLEANFNSMNYFDSDIFADFLEPESFVDVMRRTTRYEYFIKSKRFRQVIFGSLSPKRQRKIQRWWIHQIIERLINEYLVGDGANSIIAISDDEIILRADAMEPGMFDDLKEWCHLPLHIKPFQLERIGEHPYYFKRYPDGKIEIKGVPTYLMPQIYKAVKGMPIEEIDRTFYFENQVAVFKESFEI